MNIFEGKTTAEIRDYYLYGAGHIESLGFHHRRYLYRRNVALVDEYQTTMTRARADLLRVVDETVGQGPKARCEAIRVAAIALHQVERNAYHKMILEMFSDRSDEPGGAVEGE